MTSYWRGSSATWANLALGIEAREWGSTLNLFGKCLKEDRIVLYCTEKGRSGYWGLGTILGLTFTSEERIWPEEEDYRHRIRFSVDVLVAEPLGRATVMERLGKGRLEFQRQAGFIRLAPDEFATIQALVGEALSGSGNHSD